MKSESKFYIGEVIEVCSDEHSKEHHLIKAKVPGVFDEIRAYPKAGELDEPCVGDQVLLLCLDPYWFSYFIYSKLKESDFIGFRSSGKMLDITPDAMTLSVYGEEQNTHLVERPRKDIKSYIEMEDSGNINIYAKDTIEVNNGNNGGLVNINALKKVLHAILKDLGAAGSGAFLMEILSDPFLELEDEKFKH